MKLTPWEPDLRSLVDRVNKGDIDLQPEFQRQEVWSTNKKKKLIDTVLRNWSIPPIHLVETADARLARLLFFTEAGSFGVKSTESRISDRFRRPESFADAVYTRCEQAVELFSVARSIAGPARLNKASTLSWLLFFYRFTTSFFADDRPHTTLMALMNDSRQRSLSSHHFVSAAIALFDDRAALRVTDVSSVVLRDFTLWYLYFSLVEQDVPPPIPTETLQRIDRTELPTYDKDALESLLNERLDIGVWSTLL